VKKILAVSGDPGGARAMLAVLDYLEAQHVGFVIVDHKFLGQMTPPHWSRIAVAGGSLDAVAEAYTGQRFGVTLFASSVADLLPLRIARMSKEFGVPVVHLLDSWSAYAQRMCKDGQAMLVPEIYAVMDDEAFREAIADGIPESVLRVTGQPALSSLSKECHADADARKHYLNTQNLDPLRRTFCFVSEPVKADRAAGHKIAMDGRFDELNILESVCAAIQDQSEDVQLVVAPHPRENPDNIRARLEGWRGRLKAIVLRESTGREAVRFSDGVVGMSSILLYEAWLLGKQVLSIQPGVEPSSAAAMLRRPGLRIVSDMEKLKELFDGLLAGDCRTSFERSQAVMEMARHEKAPEAVLSCIRNVSLR